MGPNQQRGKVYGVKWGRNFSSQASKGPLLVELQRICLIPPASNWDNMCEMLSLDPQHLNFY